jgi:hypothetical protein
MHKMVNNYRRQKENDMNSKLRQKTAIPGDPICRRVSEAKVWVNKNLARSVCMYQECRIGFCHTLNCEFLWTIWFYVLCGLYRFRKLWGKHLKKSAPSIGHEWLAYWLLGRCMHYIEVPWTLKAALAAHLYIQTFVHAAQQQSGTKKCTNKISVFTIEKHSPE